jgi:hypothetical protein
MNNNVLFHFIQVLVHQYFFSDRSRIHQLMERIYNIFSQWDTVMVHARMSDLMTMILHWSLLHFCMFWHEWIDTTAHIYIDMCSIINACIESFLFCIQFWHNQLVVFSSRKKKKDNIILLSSLMIMVNDK